MLHIIDIDIDMYIYIYIYTYVYIYIYIMFVLRKEPKGGVVKGEEKKSPD